MSELTCDAGNRCSLFAQGAPLCGAAGNHLPAEALPGTQCPRALWGGYEQTIDPRLQRRTDPYSQALIAGGLLLELGMSPKVAIPEALEHFSTAKEILERITSEPTTPYPHYARARLGLIFLPNYTAYKFGCLPPPDVRNSQRSALSVLMWDIREAPSHYTETEDSAPQPAPLLEDIKKGIYIKLAALAVYMEAGFDVIPPIYRKNQDGFIIANDTALIPIKTTHAHPKEDRGPKPNAISFQQLVYDANHYRGRKILPGKTSDVSRAAAEHLETTGYNSLGRPRVDADYLIQRMTKNLRNRYQNKAST